MISLPVEKFIEFICKKYRTRSACVVRVADLSRNFRLMVNLLHGKGQVYAMSRSIFCRMEVHKAYIFKNLTYILYSYCLKRGLHAFANSIQYRSMSACADCTSIQICSVPGQRNDLPNRQRHDLPKRIFEYIRIVIPNIRISFSV